MQDGISFNRFLAMVRKNKGVTLATLGCGLYSESMMYRIEEGERTPDRLVRNRLLARLGTSSEGFEDYVQPDEFQRYTMQIKTIKDLESGNLSDAEQDINKLEDMLEDSNRVYWQFVFGMRARIAKEKNEFNKYKMYSEKALTTTVDYQDIFSIENKLLSPEEYYSLLYYLEMLVAINHECEKRVRDYRILIMHIKDSCLDELAKSKVYPMATYGMYQCAKKTGMIKTIKDELVKYSSESLELLRKSCRQYYLAQILEMRGELLGDEQEQKEKNWKWALEYAYNSYNVSQNMNINCFIFSGTSVSCIGDVIRNRREMLGISRNALADDVCDVKTLMRIENQKNNVRQESIDQILERLMLIPDFVRLPIVTDNEQAVVLYDKLRYAINQSSYEQQKKILTELISVLDMDNAYNRQAIGVIEAIIKKNDKRITSQEYIESLRNSFEITVKASVLNNRKKVFLTKTEMTCIYNIAKEELRSGGDKDKIKAMISILCNGKENSINDTTDFMLYVWQADIKGTPTEYKESNKIADNAARWTLKSGRVSGVHMCMYNNLWNNTKYAKVSQEKVQNVIKVCLYLSDFANDIRNYNHYQKKYNLIMAGDKKWFMH
ncbi:MAG: transcriptional regulator [Lachnospiraceae bacterium]|nr:transcriptional regulator [Lachnospiraceae bacterium]